MRIDMHCHTSEGSQDARVSIFKIVEVLKQKGYDGVLITDHNSYKGYDAWAESGRDDFVVLKGIEYDTREAGHMLIVLPEGADTSVLAYRGMPLMKLIQVVHRLGGVIGPAHPYDYCKFGMFNTRKWRRNKAVCYNFDFVEIFNSCADRYNNRHAEKLAEQYRRPTFGGSDNHRLSGIGLGYTDIEADIRNNDELIEALEIGTAFEAGGSYNPDSFACAHSFLYSCGAWAYFMVNKCMGLCMSYKRRKALRASI